MRNPWTTKNPFMSVWLSSANKVLNSARGQTAAAAKREVASAQSAAAKQIVEFWSGRAVLPKKAAKPARRRRR